MFRECLLSVIIAVLISVDGTNGQCPTNCVIKCLASQEACAKVNKEFFSPATLCSCCGMCLKYLEKGDDCTKSTEIHPYKGPLQRVQQHCKSGLKCSGGTCK